MKTTILFIFLCLLPFRGFGQGDLLIYNVNIVDVADGSLQKNRAVLIGEGKIKDIGDVKKLSRNVAKEQRINANGKYMVPGLWDMHVHLEGTQLVPDNEALLPVFLAYGITTVRDCASDLGRQVLVWRDEINKGQRIGPTIYTAGLKLEGKNSIWKGDLEIENEKELHQMLDKLDSMKVDFVKITENTLKGDLFLASVKAARTRGYRVSGHVPYDLTINELAAAGFTSIEHATYLLRLGTDEEAIKDSVISGTLTKAEAEARYASLFNQQTATANYKALGAKGMFVCPTLIGGRQLAYLDQTDHRGDVFLQYLTKRFVSNYQWRIDRMANETPAQSQQRKDRYQLLLKQMPLIQQAGITIIAGSDAAALNTYVYPAESLLDELEIFQQAGLTPLQILQSATINGTRYFGVENKTGTVTTGKNADLVLLDQNPLTDVKALRAIYGVVAKGRYYDRQMLDAILHQAHEKKMKLDEERR